MATLEERLENYADGWVPEPGDQLIGEVVDIDMRESDYGHPYPVVTVRTDSGEMLAFHAFRTVARSELAKARPEVGDRIGVAYLGERDAKKPRPGMSGRFHLYRVVVEGREAERAPVDWDAVEGQASREIEGQQRSHAQKAAREQASAREQQGSKASKKASSGPDDEIPF